MEILNAAVFICYRFIVASGIDRKACLDICGGTGAKMFFQIQNAQKSDATIRCLET
jgi:hypothetical protein